MMRSEAIVRIQDGLGFSTRQESKIILRLQEAQRELEKGKTLPRFLVEEGAAFTLLSGASTVALPTDFLRMDDVNPPHLVDEPTYYIDIKRDYKETLIANYEEDSGRPRVAYIGNNFLHFITVADTNYVFSWNYYKAADILSSEIENAWLEHAPEWLIGEAGWRMAMDVRDKDAISIFEAMRKTARAAIFGEIIASDEASGPLMMGANL